jgi:hypothetical protein
MADEWVTASELARRRGVSKGAFCRRVNRLQAQGLVHLRPGPKGAKLISVSEFERAADEATDAVRAQNGRGSAAVTFAAAEAPPPSGSDHPVLSREQARRTAADADLKELDRAERLGQLILLDKARSAATACAQRLRTAVERIYEHAEDTAITCASDGSTFAVAVLEALRRDTQGARTFFNALARSQLAELARIATVYDSGPSESDDDDPLRA